MHGADARWEKRIAGLWAEFDAYREDDFLSRIEGLVAELPPGNAVGLFEHGSAFDTVGHSERAVPLYAAALGAGLEGERRRRAVIQMASSLRNLGKSQEAVELLTAEMNVASDDLDGGGSHLSRAGPRRRRARTRSGCRCRDGAIQVSSAL